MFTPNFTTRAADLFPPNPKPYSIMFYPYIQTMISPKFAQLPTTLHLIINIKTPIAHTSPIYEPNSTHQIPPPIVTPTSQGLLTTTLDYLVQTQESIQVMHNEISWVENDSSHNNCQDLEDNDEQRNRGAPVHTHGKALTIDDIHRVC